MTLWVPFAVALGAALGAIPLIRVVARRTGYIDHPTSRKVHPNPTPLGGGLGLLFGLLMGTAAGLLIQPSGHDARLILAWLAGLLLVALIGYLDDRSPMTPLAKLAGQIAAALVLVLGSGVPDPQALHGLAVPVAVVGAVALMNACNFLDNMDGILGGIAVVCAIGFAVMAPPESAAAYGALALAGAAAGFLAYNFAPARIFMGDAGSLPVGYLLAAFGLALASGSRARGAEAGPLLGLALIVGYPLFDLTFVTITRLADGRRPWAPGHDHSTHRLNRLLGNSRRTALVVYALTTLLAAAGVAVAHSPSRPSLALALLTCLFLLALGLRLARVPAA
jgi:UDP-GlcNAc:undecaprenyl-phosphate GlcNAc-1-phosphate transferase